MKYLLGQRFKPWEANPRSYQCHQERFSIPLSPQREKLNTLLLIKRAKGNLAADEVLIEFQKAPLDSIDTVYKVTWGGGQMKNE